MISKPFRQARLEAHKQLKLLWIVTLERSGYTEEEATKLYDKQTKWLENWVAKAPEPKD